MTACCNTKWHLTVAIILLFFHKMYIQQHKFTNHIYWQYYGNGIPMVNDIFFIQYARADSGWGKENVAPSKLICKSTWHKYSIMVHDMYTIVLCEYIWHCIMSNEPYSPCWMYFLTTHTKLANNGCCSSIFGTDWSVGQNSDTSPVASHKYSGLKTTIMKYITCSLHSTIFAASYWGWWSVEHFFTPCTMWQI